MSKNGKEPAQLPKRRESLTYELVIVSRESGRFKMFLGVGIVDGRVVEIWLDVAKEGAMLRELMHAWAALFSIALQGGVPLARLVKLYKEWGFEPCGRVEGLDKITECKSALSLVVSVLEAEFSDDRGPDAGQGTLFPEASS